MLSLHLDSADVEGPPWRPTGTGWAAGPCTVEPFRHAALEDFALVSDGRLLIVVRERCAGEPPPERGTGALQGGLTALEPGRLDDVAAGMRAWPLGWLTVEVTGSGRGIRVVLETGDWGVAPVFAIARDGELWGDWDPARLFPVAGGPKLDRVRAAHFLAVFDSSYSSATLVSEIQMHTERSRMVWDPAADGRPALSVEYPVGVDPPLPRRLKPGADPPAAFWEILTSSLRRWLEGYPEGVVVEVSGGLDSAVVAAAASSVAGQPVRSCGIALAGASREDERARRSVVARLFGLEDREVDILDWLPFAPDTCRIAGGPVVPWEECYYEAADAMLAAATGAGGTLVLTGLGGDELCGRRPGERPAPARGGDNGGPASPWLAVPAFLSADTRAAYDETRGRLARAPHPLAAISVPECIAIGSAMYMRRGTWAVHPLATPQLVQFCAQLPREWRSGRRVERTLLSRLGLPRQLTHPAVRDDFMPALAAAFRHRARPAVDRLFSSPRLADLGLVDRDRLVAHYAAWCAEGSDVDGAMPLYAAAALELTVRALEG